MDQPADPSEVVHGEADSAPMTGKEAEQEKAAAAPAAADESAKKPMDAEEDIPLQVAKRPRGRPATVETIIKCS